MPISIGYFFYTHIYINSTAVLFPCSIFRACSMIEMFWRTREMYSRFSVRISQNISDMETKIFKFEEKQITFELSKDNNVMINATEMAKAFGKRVDVFLKTDHVNEFISEIELTPYGGSSTCLKRDEIIKNVNGVGTWMHRVLALKFAAWLSPKFELWVYSTIEKLLFGKHVEREQSLERTIVLKNELHELSLKPDKTGDDFERYLVIETQLKHEKALRNALTRETVNEMQLLFNDQN